jgi:hypothetical protein
MKQFLAKKQYTVCAWDETGGTAALNIARGTGLTFSVPKTLPYREVYFYVEPKTASLGDYFITGEVVLSLEGENTAVLPANVGWNANNMALNKSVPTLFSFGELNRSPTTGMFFILGAENGAIITLSNGFTASATNNIMLVGRRVLAEADRFSYVINDWSRAASGLNAVTGYRAFGMVLSSNNPLQ